MSWEFRFKVTFAPARAKLSTAELKACLLPLTGSRELITKARNKAIALIDTPDNPNYSAFLYIYI